jgi:hypothetical protein
MFEAPAMISAGGKRVFLVSSPDQTLALAHGVSAEFMLAAVNTATLDSVRASFDDGRLRTGVGTVSHPPGKIVLKVSH